VRDGELAASQYDGSPEMLRLATDRLGDRARILNADPAEPLDFAADASADLVVASLAMHYLADWTGPLPEDYRVLKPDGAVVFSTHHPAMDALRRGAGSRPRGLSMETAHRLQPASAGAYSAR
jgi:ubiquinone/menaquinone biosynthesis C-methylase UbiE